jgi:ATP-dependent DNA helicase RecQ
VRHDILEQLQLRQPHKFIASFHRANLRYVVHACDKKTHRTTLMAALRAYAGESVIVYSPTIAQVEETVDFLAERRIAAVPYHGQMETNLRRRNQERWMNDEVRVLVGTVAFGLGINKPAVRAVIHTSLPKSIEQYYQEAGRAGRDGLPSDCLLLWQPKDAGLLAYFIDKLNDSAEKERAWQRYHAVRRFAESARCRHLQICEHFGQTPKWLRCDMCDVCGNAPSWLLAPIEETAAPRQRRPVKKSEPPAPRFEMPDSPAEEAPRRSEPDRSLLDFFKQWRRGVAQRTQVPAYVVLSDAALDDLCRKQPANLRELLSVSGIGERKAELYGGEIFGVFEAFHKGARAAAKEAAQISPADETIRLLAEGKTFEQIAELRGRKPSTVVNMVADLIEKGRLEYRIEWVGEEDHKAIAEAIGKLGSQWLKPLREALPEHVSYDQIRLVVAWARQQSTS